MFSLFEAFLITVLPLILVHLFLNFRRLWPTGIPGPLIASITDLWRAYLQRRPHFPENLARLHEKYGKLIRLGPNYVSVNDPAALSIIYGTSPTWRKGDSYKVLIGLNQGREVPSIVSMLDETRHSQMKRGIGSAFATNNLLDYEHHIDESAEELFEVVRKNRSVDMGKWISLATMDILSRTAFSESLGFVASGGDVGGTIHSIEIRFQHWTEWGAIPGLERLIFRNPITKRIKGGSTPLAMMAAGRLHARKTATEPPAQRDLLQKYIEASEKHPDAIDSTSIIGMAMSTIAAGADTTAVTLTATLFYLMKNPRTYDRLMAEIDGTSRSGALSNPPRWEEVNKLQYLDVVIKESMRCYPIGAFSIDRIVPKGGVEIDGKFIPEGTTVGCVQMPIHRIREVWGGDVDDFRPERWLEADEFRRRRMEKAFLGFSMGKRICIGMHIAQMEMKKMIPHMMMNFKMKLDDPKAEIEVLKPSAIRYPAPVWVTFEDRLME